MGMKGSTPAASTIYLVYYRHFTLVATRDFYRHFTIKPN